VQTEDELLDIEAVCRFLGGEKTPLNPSTVYRGIRDGNFPAPVRVGLHVSRWLRSELESALAWRVAARNGTTRAECWSAWIAELAEQPEEAA
jgi:predicted DNA-binding transcriptional regulator AlpA